MNAELQPIVGPPAEQRGMTIVERAIEKGGIDADNLGKLVELQMKWDDRRAAEEFAAALAGFNAECPTIPKRRGVKNKDGSTRYMYAAYEDIKLVTKPLEKKWGISTSFSFDTSQEGRLVGTCRVRVGSHFEDHTLALRVPKGFGTNEAQDDGQAYSYLKRYLYCAALDIVIADEDKDATGLWSCINSEQVAELQKWLAEKGVDEGRFLAWASETAKFEVPSLKEFPVKLYATGLDMLKRKKGGQG